MPAGSLQLICPNLACRSLLRVSPTARGRAVKCPQCQKKVIIPDGKAAEAKAAKESPTVA